ncbi:MAG: hypothetical protein R3B67_13660 [Phycisphaerales bacterium]
MTTIPHARGGSSDLPASSSPRCSSPRPTAGRSGLIGVPDDAPASQAQ